MVTTVFSFFFDFDREQNAYVDQQLRAQERQFKEISHEYHISREELKKVREVNGHLLEKSSESYKSLVRTDTACGRAKR